MPIDAITPPEPLAGPPGNETGPTLPTLLLAQTQAGKTLVTILGRYCKREISGRSILIAGHRGAGKTTLVKAAIQELRQGFDKDAIPLYVQIHGPDLLGGETVLGHEENSKKEKGEKEKNESRASQESAEKSSESDTRPATADDESRQQDREEVKQARTSLRVLTVALHRAFVTDLGWAFEKGVSPQEPVTLNPAVERRSHDLQELAAQLRLDFDDLVETDALRWIWNRAGFLHRGVLRIGAAEEVAKKYFSTQGLLEIVAATCVSDSFMRGVAKVDDLDSTKAEAELKQTREIEKWKERKELVNSLTGMFAGGLVGTGVFVAGSGSKESLVLSALTFILGAVVSTTVLNYSSVRSRSQKRSKERNIRWDRSVASLDLMLPLAIARILDAGRAPIFVIDELDKVNNVGEKLEKLINRLKHIVADRALFCFLVDRPYFERVREISRTQPQRKEHTFFSERLYVIASSAEWRKYLLQILRSNSPSQTDRVQILALTYLLMARSKMHAIDMRREIEALPRDLVMRDRLDLPDLLGLPLYRNMIFMQSVVEYTLEDNKLKSRLQREPYFAQFTYDALYYLLRRWEQDQPPRVSANLVRSYLEERAFGTSTPETGQFSKFSFTVAVPVGSNVTDPKQQDASSSQIPSEPMPKLSTPDFALLYSAVEQVAQQLSDVGQFRDSVRKKVERKELPPEWNDVVEILPDQPVLYKVDGEWQWLVDINANPLQIPAQEDAFPAVTKAGGPEPGQVAYVEKQIKLVEELEKAIRAYTEQRIGLESLGSELRLLAISPTFGSFANSASNYRANAGLGPSELPYPSLTTDQSMIREYCENVRRSLRAIKRAVFLAELLATGKEDLPSAWTRTKMLRLLATDLDFQRMSSVQIDELLGSFREDLEIDPADVGVRNAFAALETETTPLDEQWIRELQTEMKARAVRVLALDWSTATAEYFSRRTRALILHARNRQPLTRLSLYELRVRGFFDAPSFHGDADGIPLIDYANALAETRRSLSSSSFLFALALFEKLGFGRQIEAVLTKFGNRLSSTEMAPDLLEAARTGQRAGERVLLIIGGTAGERVKFADRIVVSTPKGEGSGAAAWTISHGHAVFPVHQSDLDTLLTPYPDIGDNLSSSLDLSVELIDEGIDMTKTLQLVPLCAQLGSNLVGKVSSLDDAVATVKRRLPAS